MLTTPTIMEWLPILKWVWAIACLFCAVVAAFATHAAYSDARVVKQTTYDIHSPYRLQAWQVLRHEGIVLIFQVIVCLIRLWALTWAGPRYAPFATDWAIDATLITLAQVLLSASSIIDLRDRSRSIKGL